MPRIFHEVNFSDDRGTIRDLFDALDAVTEVVTYRGKIRGNHIHHKTEQYVFVVTGALSIINDEGEFILRAGDMWLDPPGQPHAWQALEDTLTLVFTKGPRSGDAYESDTERLKVPLI